jgi:peptidyl-prolyl cis-trans isomerase D
MLQGMRENMKGAIAVFIVIFLGLILAIGLVDLNSLNGGYSADDIASVNGRTISERDLQIALSQEKQRLKSQFGNNLPAEFLSDDRLREPVLQGLVQRKVLLDKAVDGRMTMSDSDIDTLITQMPEFQSDGQFEPQLFVQAIRNIGHTPDSFRILLRDDVVVNQLRNGIAFTTFITDQELKNVVALSRQTRDFNWLQLPLGDLPESMVVNDEEVKRYYDENMQSYVTEETVAVEYIDLKVSDIAETVIVGEGEVKQQYEQELLQVSSSPQSEAAHIMIEGDDDAALQKIKDVQDKLAAGDDFAIIAVEYSDDFGSRENGGNLGLTSGDVFPPAFESALAELSEGSVSDPIKIDNATHFIKLVSIKNNTPPTLEESQARIESELKLLQAEQIFVEKLTALKDLAFNAENLSDVADQLSLSVVSTALFTREGGPEPVLSDGRVVDAAFGVQVLQQGYSSDVLELAPDNAVVIKLIKHEPVRILALEEKQDDIVAELKLKKAKEQLSAQAESLKAALESGETLADLAIENDLALNTESTIARDGGGLSQELVRHVFELSRPENSKPTTSSLYLDNNDYALVSLSAVNDAKFEDLTEEEKRGARLSLTRSISVDEFQAWQQRLVSQAGVNVN